MKVKADAECIYFKKVSRSHLQIFSGHIYLDYEQLCNCNCKDTCYVYREMFQRVLKSVGKVKELDPEIKLYSFKISRGDAYLLFDYYTRVYNNAIVQEHFKQIFNELPKYF